MRLIEIVVLVSSIWLTCKCVNGLQHISTTWFDDKHAHIDSVDYTYVLPEVEVYNSATQTENVDPNFFNDARRIERKYQREIRRLQRHLLNLKRYIANDFERRSDQLANITQDLCAQESKLATLKPEVERLESQKFELENQLKEEIGSHNNVLEFLDVANSAYFGQIWSENMKSKGKNNSVPSLGAGDGNAVSNNTSVVQVQTPPVLSSECSGVDYDGIDDNANCTTQ